MGGGACVQAVAVDNAGLCPGRQKMAKLPHGKSALRMSEKGLYGACNAATVDGIPSGKARA